MFFVTADFAVICVPHGNNAASVVSRSPDNHNHPIVQLSNRKEAFLAVVNTVIESGKVKACENLIGVSKIEPTLQQGFFPFYDIELDYHFLNVTTTI